MMPPLPNWRVETTAPFASNAVDASGPIPVKQGKFVAGAYIMLYCCPVTRAIRLDLRRPDARLPDELHASDPSSGAAARRGCRVDFPLGGDFGRSQQQTRKQWPEDPRTLRRGARGKVRKLSPRKRAEDEVNFEKPTTNQFQRLTVANVEATFDPPKTSQTCHQTLKAGN